ncbi:MAG: outer membrane lipoprotein chaperone LolA [Bacteroidota bacterium]
MKKKLTMALAFFCVIETSAQEKELTVKQVTEQLHHRYEMIDDAIVQFEQHVKFGFSNVEQNFNGILKMKKPKHYRIESEHQTIVTDGTTVWAYSTANNQVIVDNYKENSNSISPEQFMLNLPANYYASLLGYEKQSAGNVILLKLVPKDDRSFVKSVKISVEENNWLVRKIVILDVNETETTYTVKDIELNTNIKDKTFTFVTPEGAEVVDLR